MKDKVNVSSYMNKKRRLKFRAFLKKINIFPPLYVNFRSKVQLLLKNARISPCLNKENQLKFRGFLKKAYECISVLSTLSIFSWLVFLAINLCFQPNVSDNDIIMREICNQLNNDEEVSQLYTHDLHGFGNNSVIVIARSPSSTLYGEDINNRLIILEPIETSFFQKVHDPFGVKSKFTTTFSFKLNYDGAGLIPWVENVDDVCGDTSSEIVVSYQNYSSTYGSHVYAIFTYSYEEQKYRLIGTYPIPQKYDRSVYDENNNVIGYGDCTVDGNPYSLEFKEIETVYECNDGANKYYLNEYSDSCYKNYWIGRNLVSVINVHRYDDIEISDPAYYSLVNIYRPVYSDNNLRWVVDSSEYTNKINTLSNESEVRRYVDNLY